MDHIKKMTYLEYTKTKNGQKIRYTGYDWDFIATIKEKIGAHSFQFTNIKKLPGNRKTYFRAGNYYRNIENMTLIIEKFKSETENFLAKNLTRIECKISKKQK